MFGSRGILDTDLYKLTMQQAVCQLYPKAGARYAFVANGKLVTISARYGLDPNDFQVPTEIPESGTSCWTN